VREQLLKTEQFKAGKSACGSNADSSWRFLYIAETKAPELRWQINVIVTVKGYYLVVFRYSGH
jgi:hypothetical protein